MNKILLIIKREYLSRVKKKSFIIMTILGPILMASIFVVPVWLSTQPPKKQNFEVIDESGLLKNLIPEKDGVVHFDYPPITLQQAQDGFYDTNYDGILWIPEQLFSSEAIKIFYKDQVGLGTTEYINSTISKMLYDVILYKNNVNLNAIKNAQQRSSFKLLVQKLNPNGKSEKINDTDNFFIGFAFAMMIYFFTFLYGVQIMRSVMEEKTSRIVEVILSSVRPFQLMMGKIIGVSLVGLTQFLLWVVLTSSITSIVSITLLKDVDLKQIQQKEQVIKIGADINYEQMHKIEKNDFMEHYNAIQNIDFKEILICFLFYFLGAYFLYGAIFAAIGSAVDSESDTQQFMFPVTIPLILGLFIAIYSVSNPGSSIGFWFSMIPFTSPIVMMARLPYGVPMWEIILSISILILTFVFMTWLAGRIYRTGILMYGKKVSWRELGKWLFYKG